MNVFLGHDGKRKIIALANRAAVNRLEPMLAIHSTHIGSAFAAASVTAVLISFIAMLAIQSAHELGAICKGSDSSHESN